MSICIVHRDGWAVSDSKETCGLMIIPTVPRKIVKSAGHLIACVGDGILQQDICRIVEDQGHESDVLETICQMMSERSPHYEGGILSVDYKHNLLHIDQVGSYSKLDVDFWAIGCAEWYVLGRLHLIVEQKGHITIDDAEQAIVAAAKFDNGIDNRVQRVFLDRI